MLAEPEVQIRWLPGLGGSPGGVDLTMVVEPAGVIARAVTLPEALTVCALIDAFCPTTLYETVRRLASLPTTVENTQPCQPMGGTSPLT